MSIESENKPFSPGQIFKSVWDESNNTLRTAVVGSEALDVLHTIVYDYSDAAVTSATYVQIEDDLPVTAKKLQIFDSSGVPLYLATGASTAEVNKMVIVPGGNGNIEVALAENVRLTIKAVDDSATAGLLIINVLG